MDHKLYIVDGDKFTRSSKFKEEYLRTIEIDRYQEILVMAASGTMNTLIKRTPTGVKVNGILHVTTKGMCIYAKDLYDGDKVFVSV